MAVGQGGGVGQVRTAAADLDLVEKAVQARQAADAYLTEVVRAVLDRQPRAVTVEQVAELLGITRRALYKRLSGARSPGQNP